MVIYPYWFISCNCSKCATLVPEINDEKKMDERNRKTLYFCSIFFFCKREKEINVHWPCWGEEVS